MGNRYIILPYSSKNSLEDISSPCSTKNSLQDGLLQDFQYTNGGVKITYRNCRSRVGVSLRFASTQRGRGGGLRPPIFFLECGTQNHNRLHIPYSSTLFHQNNYKILEFQQISCFSNWHIPWLHGLLLTLSLVCFWCYYGD